MNNKETRPPQQGPGTSKTPQHQDNPVAVLCERLRTAGYEPDEQGPDWYVKCACGNESVVIRRSKPDFLHVSPQWCDHTEEVEGIIKATQPKPTTDEHATSMLDQLRAALLDSAGLDSITPPEPLIHGILQLDSIAWLQGKPGHGKSFVALDMAGCVGTGNPWQGHRTTQGKVLYLAAEGVSGVRQRVRAWEKSMGEDMKEVSFLPIAVQSTNATQWDAFTTLAAEIGTTLIIIDTQARVTVGQEENSARDMGEFVHRVEKLRAATKACVLVVHHEGRQGEHMRGSTAIEGAATTIVRVRKDGETLTIECPKQKDAPEFDKFELRLISSDMSAVVCLTDPMRQSSVLSGMDEKLVSTWRDIHETNWVSAPQLIETTDIPKATVHRAINKLVRLGQVEKGGTEKRPTYRLKT